MMRAWTEWCDDWTAKAVGDDRALLDRELIAAEIRRRRYKDKEPRR
jgi:hypothetical protein